MRRGDLKQVQMLIRSGVSVNEGWTGCCSLLMVAIEEGHTDIALELIKEGADVHAKDNNLQTALHIACDKELEDVIQALVDRGSRVNERDKLDRTPLMIASRATHYAGSSDQRNVDLLIPACSRAAILMCLLRAGASCEGLSAEQLNDLLCHACSKGDVRAVRTLLENGCGVSQLCKKDQYRLFRQACDSGSLFVVQALLQNGWSVNVLSRRLQYHLLKLAFCESQWTIVRDLLRNGCRMGILGKEEQKRFLQHAHHAGDEFVAHTLLKNGCRANILPSEEQEEILNLASHAGEMSVLWALLKSGFRVSKLSRKALIELLHYAIYLYNLPFSPYPRIFNILVRKNCEELFHHACNAGDVFVVHALLKNGCSVSSLKKSEDQDDLFCHASHVGDLFVVHALIENGCSVNILSSVHQEELLHQASHEGEVFVVHTLLKNAYGCCVNILPSENQEELLCQASHEGDMFVVHILLKSGCNVNILSSVDQEGLLCQASREGDMFVVHTLLKSGCSVNCLPSEDQENLLCQASHEGDMFVVHALLKSGCNVNILSGVDQEGLLCQASREGDMFVVHTLLKSGCSVNCLPSEDQENLLCQASHEGDMFVVHALLDNGCSVNSLPSEVQEELLRHASQVCDMFVVHALLKSSCSVNILSGENQEELLHQASREGDMFVVRTLLKSGCSVTILSSKNQEELLRQASCEGDMFVVHTLLKSGCSVTILSSKNQEELLRQASREGDMFVVHTLFKNSCSVNILPREDQEELLHQATHEGELFVAHALLKNGCSVNILSSEDQEELLHDASHEGDMFVVHTLLDNGCNVNSQPSEDQEELFRQASQVCDMFVVHALLKNGCKISILSEDQQKVLCCHACQIGDAFVVEALISSGFNVNCVFDGYTPLMIGACEGHEEVLKKLILAGADVGMQIAHGDTALHLAALNNHIQSGILLVEGGASTRIKNTLFQTPLDVASKEFKEAIEEAMSFTTRKTLCIIGNAEGGKSTLIAALQAESNSFIGKTLNRMRRVDDRLKRTAGIETLPHCSQRYGEVLFYDFAGQHEYHGPHQMFLEALLCKPGVSVTLLLVVKATKEEETILHQLHRWLSPVALLATTASPPQVIIIGSFLDKVKSKLEATAKLTRCIEATKKDLDKLPLEFMGLCMLNCRQPESAGINKLCKFLRDIPIPDFRATHTQYSLAWVLSQIRLSFKSRASPLHEFSKWIQDNMNNLPLTMPPAEEVCQDLSAAGHALFLLNKEDPTKSWLVLDLPSILHDVYGTLFSQSKGIVNEFGLLHLQHLNKLFPNLDLAMVQQLLISLDFCIPVDPVVLKVELSKLTQSEEASGWLFFPALISAKPSSSIVEAPLQQNIHHFCWQLKTSNKHSISARVLQTILLHMAAHFVVKHHQTESTQQHCCSIWWNGISWQSKKGIDVAVHISNNQVIQVVGASITSADKSCHYLTEIISDILSTVRQLSPKLAATAYIIYPPKLPSLHEVLPYPLPRELFPVADIRHSIKNCDEFSLSLKDSDNCSTRVPVSDLFGGCTPSLVDIERIFWAESEPNSLWTLTEPCQVQASMVTGEIQTDILSQTVYGKHN